MKLTFVYSYYENPNTLDYLFNQWKKYDEDVLKNIEFIITDDCSKKFPLKNINKPEELNIRYFEIQQKVDWNWLACRNVGAFHSKGKWLLITDIDHFVRHDNIKVLHKKIKYISEEYVYMLERRNLSDKRINNHGNSFLMTREMYWKIGGYDETLSGRYSGTTMAYKKRILWNTKGLKLVEIPLHCISDNDIDDSQTIELSRNKNMKDLEFCKRVINNKGRVIRVLTFPYQEVKCG